MGGVIGCLKLPSSDDGIGSPFYLSTKVSVAMQVLTEDKNTICLLVTVV